MVTAKSVPEGVQAVFPMLVCRSPEAEMNFCVAAFGAIEQVRRPGPGRLAHSHRHAHQRRVPGGAVRVPGCCPSRARVADGSSPVVLLVYVADVDQALERAVAQGATVLIPAQDQFWGDRSARILDPCGQSDRCITH